MSKKNLTPYEARKSWKYSTVASPVAIVNRICERYPNKPNRELVAICEHEGVTRSTASVYVSRFKSKRKEK